MSWFTLGTSAIASTQGIATNPSTATLLAEIDSTQLGRHVVPQGGGNFQVTWICGSQSTNVLWQFEQCLSTGLDVSTSGSTQDGAIAQTFAYTPINQGAQFITKHKLNRGDRLRARINASISAGTATCKIIAEPLD
jgi:hypothetical protein